MAGGIDICGHMLCGLLLTLGTVIGIQTYQAISLDNG